MNNVNDLNNKDDKEGEAGGNTLQSVTIKEPNKNGVLEPVLYVFTSLLGIIIITIKIWFSSPILFAW